MNQWQESKGPVRQGQSRSEVSQTNTQPLCAGIGQTSPATPPVSANESDLILIIDNSMTVRAILTIHLCRAGYACRGFADGVSALRWLHQNAPCVPRLMLLDIDLPGMDGYQIAQHIRARPCWNAMVLVMLTGRDRVTDRLKGRLLGAQAYLTKPFQVQQLLSVVQEALAPHVPQPK